YYLHQSSPPLSYSLSTHSSFTYNHLILYRSFSVLLLSFIYNDTPNTQIYTLSLHDALPICCCAGFARRGDDVSAPALKRAAVARSEEHTSELQSHLNLVCRLLLEKKKKE